ncbi:hypothetical protein B5S30_g2725 [[Candida] boidinii]|nr:hypothetical protein B5S30_g2725 [[Candida] boidinii]
MTVGDSDSVEKQGAGTDMSRQKRLISFALSKKVPPLPEEDERTIYPGYFSQFHKYFFFSWMFPLLKVGYLRTLQPEDMPKLTEDLKVEKMHENFEKIFGKYVSQLKQDHLAKKYAERNETAETSSKTEEEDFDDFKIPVFILIKSLYFCFFIEYNTGIIFKIFSDVLSCLLPLLQKALINFVEKRSLGLDTIIGQGVGYSIGVCLMILFNGICINHLFYNSMMTGARVKAILTKSLLLKSFVVSSKGRHRFPFGKINTLMGTDLSRVDFAVGFLPFGITFLIPFAITLALLIVNIGPVALVGLGIFLLSTIIFGASARSMIEERKAATIWTDKRVNLIKELLKNFRVVKYYSWEDSYAANLKTARENEMKHVRKIQLIRNAIIAYAVTLPNTTSMITFLSLYGIDSSRSPADIFSSLSLFQVLANIFLMVPMAVATGADALVGLRRIAEFLSCPDSTVYDESEDDDFKLVHDEMDKENEAIRIKNATFKWDVFKLEEEDNMTSKQKKKHLKEEKKRLAKLAKKVAKGKAEPEAEKKKAEKNSAADEEELGKTQFAGLNNINLSIKKGEFVVITGLIGSGKSSLLNAISGFMRRSEGHVNVSGSLIFCGQPWVQNTTIRENIVFGLPYDAEKYNKVLNACALESDLEILPAGDFTQVGERGITLSGGQKARINLARAVYAAKDIILMDDVLSAVDAKVGRNIMNKCILGLLKNSTRILATHQLSLISQADKVIFLNGDGSIDIGSLEELGTRNQNFIDLMKYSNKKVKEEEANEYSDEEEDIFDEKEASSSSEDDEKTDLNRILSSTLKRQFSTSVDAEKLENDEMIKAGKLVVAEEMAVNRLKLAVYRTYLRLGSGVFGFTFLPIFLLLATLSTFLSLFTNTWLSFWTGDRFEGKSDGFYIGLYVMFTILTVVFMSTEFASMVYFSNNAAKLFNILASNRVIHTPMSFIDKTPMGRIINRFTKDTDVVDNEIVENIRMFSSPFCTIVGILILCIIYLPWFAIAVPFLVAIFVVVADYFQASAREVKRLEAVKRSNVYAHFNESLTGMDVIKAYGVEERFFKESDTYINEMNESYYITIANQRWLAIHLDIVACCFAFLICMLCVTRQFKISASSTGLLLTYVINVAGMLSFMLRSYTQLENEMNSVERLNHYACDLEQEAPFEIPERDPHPDWPAEGAIQFDNVCLRYREDLPTVLKNISLNIKPNERIGICGRTGAGKSSIMTALYRLVELSEGSIFIDGVDISKLGLHKLRSKLSIIPQDPVLFSGSIRSNLDPFHTSTDDELWEALRVSGLIKGEDVAKAKLQDKDDESLHKFHLEQDVEDDGANFSLGERQLIALARALIRNSKILILDEATSSVDYETDAKIQQTIATEFSHCTILCIAHRLKTIIDYDRILVLDKGEIAEFDQPKTLYQQEGSIFRSMCDKSGVSEEDFGKSQS